MALFLKPKPGEKPLMERFSAFTERVKTAQSRLREQKRQKVRDETMRLREEASLLKAQNKLANLRENLNKRKKQSQPSLFGNNGGMF